MPTPASTSCTRPIARLDREAARWAHGRPKFLDLARLNKAPVAAKAVKRIDVLAIEREINGLVPQERRRVRQKRSRPLIAELEAQMREQRAGLPRAVTRPRQSITRSTAGTYSPASSMTGVRAYRTTPRTRADWSSPWEEEIGPSPARMRGGRRAAAIFSLIATANLNDIDPQA
jgi:transposase